MKKSILKSAFVCLTSLIAFSHSLAAECDIECDPCPSVCKGSIDIAPAYIHVDILQSNKTIKTMDLPAIRAEGKIVAFGGWCLKPTFTYGNNNGYLLTTGIGIGHCIPWGDFIFTPTVGYTYTEVDTKIHVFVSPLIPFKVPLKEKFNSNAPYIGLEAVYNITPCFRVYGLVQYGWSFSRATLKNKDRGIRNTTHEHSKGPNYGGVIEYDLNKKWSVNIGGGYNISLSKEKHGLRAYGFKAGVSYWF